MNNTQDQSVSASSNKSKAPRDKKTKKSKNQIEFVAIPKQDLIWAEQQNQSVMRLWMKSWECDPYGSRWMNLNHSLSKASFFRAKKIISDKGLFIFKSERSIVNGRETAYWSVKNLHGARRKNFGIELDNTKNATDSNLQSPECNPQSQRCSRQSHGCDPQSHGRDSVSQKSPKNQSIPAPSITPQQHLTNSSKELVKVLSGEEEKDKNLDQKNSESSNRSSPPSESIAEGETQNENQVQSLHSFHSVTVVPDCLEKEEEAKAKSVEEQTSMGAACPQTPRGQKGKEITSPTKEVLNQEYIPNPHSQDAIIRANAQKKAIEEAMKTKEYQKISEESRARIWAILEKNKKKK